MSEPDKDVDRTIGRIIDALDIILVQYGREKGLKVIERRFTEAALKYAKAGDLEMSTKFMEVLADVKIVLGVQSN